VQTEQWRALIETATRGVCGPEVQLAKTAFRIGAAYVDTRRLWHGYTITAFRVVHSMVPIKLGSLRVCNPAARKSATLLIFRGVRGLRCASESTWVSVAGLTPSTASRCGGILTLVQEIALTAASSRY
jgi:hypothetical protein